MKKTTLRALASLLGTAVLCIVWLAGTAFAAAPTDIPTAYVLYDGNDYYLIDYEDLLDSYLSYTEDPNSDEAKLAKFYFDTLEAGFEEHFIAYVSGVTNKFVSFAAVLDKYIDTESVAQTYGWFNSVEATSAFNTSTELVVLGPDGSAQGHVTVDSSGYEATPTSSPTPTQTIEPTPTQTIEPTPTQTIEPTPTQTIEPTPTQTIAPTPTPTTIVSIPNSSVETADPADSTKPEHWTNGFWGTNTATFTYLNEGHTGNRSVKVEVTNYTDGDAKWYFDPIPLEHRSYMLGEYYRSNVDTNVIIAVDTTDGGKVYIDLPPAPASENWTSYQAAFTMPENGVRATVYHLLNKNGWLITDDYRIDPYDVQVELIANPSVETVDPGNPAYV